ncbi:PIN domain-containing protein [Burkholderia cepacia]|uniref:DUF4935 domain-containing protein n=1 Tax=Burkholderia cepacia TaxID=292 RepID=A0A6N4JM86_BURCE|nr:PIN domain-containing protein [Burkholderia cepacia]MBA9902331.1 hypothetical protein [Burkholderia cepacia]MBA9949266.1 hypothetical protein [Burkholderia cepacia]MBA9979566.1 hypothetical protein [Burkholderia cepacia]MBA9998389.1 hypothetical protein [Burkholderia cepacia]MBB0006358.1 hypothetical protein [Burkholderia cepacia]
MANQSQKIFLDANVVIQEGKKGSSPTLERLVDLVEAGFIEVYTTDLTKTEIAKKHIENDFNLAKDFARPHVREVLSEMIGSALPEVSKAQFKDALHKKYTASTERLFGALNATTLSIDDVKPSTVLDAYARQEGFFSGEGKKDQFPDAFIFEALKGIAEDGSKIIIVSNDGDFDKPVKETSNFSQIKTFSDLFNELGLGIDVPDVEDFLDAHDEQIVELFDEQVSSWGLGVSDVEDGEIEESTVTKVVIDHFNAFRSIKSGGDILVTGLATVTADVSYTHPDWDTAAWDSEDKVAIPFDDVSGETEVQFGVRFTLDLSVDDQGRPEAIDGVNLVSRFGLWVAIRDEYL